MITDEELREAAAVLGGEGASLPYETRVRQASTFFNRLEANREEEFGGTMHDVLNKENAYYAVKNQNDPYTWGMTGNFPDKNAENNYKENLSIVYGLHRGTIERQEGQFFITPKEVKHFKKNPKKFDLKQVRGVGTDDTYNYFSY